jgi:hypothetical protein
VNGPLQQRTDVLDLDFSRATAFPIDYDTDLESDWSDLSKTLLQLMTNPYFLIYRFIL